jgi:hypothetical protein
VESDIAGALQRTRERHGADLAAIAAHFQLSPALLRDIEAGRITHEAEGMAERAHLRVYARLLGFDAEAVLAGKPVGEPSDDAPIAAVDLGSAPTAPDPTMTADERARARRRLRAQAAPPPARQRSRPGAPRSPTRQRGARTDTPDEQPTVPPPAAVRADTVEADPVEADPVEPDPVEADPVESDPVEADLVATAPPEPDPVERRPVDPHGGRLEAAEEDLLVDEEDDEVAASGRMRLLLGLSAVLTVGVIIGLLLTALSRPSVVLEPGGGSEQEAQTTTATTPPPFARATPQTTPEPTPTPTPTPVEEEADEDEPFTVSGVTVQVLDGRWDDGAAYDEVIDLLAELGFEVVDSGRAGRRYAETTLFYTDGNAELAEELAAAEGRFGVVEENTRGLSETLDLHVVVGADWPDPIEQ